ncbi:MAG: ribonuclease D [Hyphomicrobiales bacterium]|nr:ribonuclease D [Hyphomicrobiales bacterium]MCY4048693.1 ribonuclease D [Hyphomicrobiales bacterium]MCY4053143.1 ribonuclease D [Hyphomicrobiales bacterium]
MKYILHHNDIPDDFEAANSVAVDTEALGLNPKRDPLCLVQLRTETGPAHLVRLERSNYNAPNLKALLTNPDIVKIFHYARFDLGMLRHHLGIAVAPVYCTKIASKLARTYTDRHGLKDLLRELLNIDISKQQQSSDWGAAKLSKQQLEYAATDVEHLHALHDKLQDILEREGRDALARKCFEFLPTQVELDLAGWPEQNIFSH